MKSSASAFVSKKLAAGTVSRLKSRSNLLKCSTGSCITQRNTCAAMLVLLLSACTHVYTPHEQSLKEGAVSGLAPQGGVTLVNVAPQRGEQLFTEIGAHTYLGDMRQWTEVAIKTASRELNKRGAPTGQGSHVLKIAVDDVDIIRGMWVLRAIIQLEAQAGDGPVQTFEGNIASGVSLEKAIDAALSLAVTAMLNDKAIQGYLSQQPMELIDDDSEYYHPMDDGYDTQDAYR